MIVKDLPADINIGLAAYGHRRKGDCNDVETLIPLGPLDAEAFLSMVDALNPKGKTPMVRSIRKTADAIKHLEDETTILLVTDDQVAHRKVVFAKSQVIVTMKAGSGNNISGYVRIVDSKTGQCAEKGDHAAETSRFTVSPGEYYVDMECSNTDRRIKSEQFVLHAGESKNVTGICANARIGVLVIGANDQPIAAYIRIVEVPPDNML